MKKNQIENIRTDCYEKKYQIGDKECKVLIEDAYYAEWKGNTEVLDESMIDGMCKEILEVAAKYSTKYNPLPARILLSHKP